MRSPRRARDEDHGGDSPAQPLVLVALSGGADSLALAAALAFEAPRAGVRSGAIIVDHGLQTGSAEVAGHAAEQARSLGLDPVIVSRVQVPGASEAAARAARYAALEKARRETGAASLVTAHTRDDQAEQVLLALARGSGTRAIAGIPPRRDLIERPFLTIDRATTLTACRAQGLEPWIDPHNSDHAFTRVRVRERVLPVIAAELGSGVAANLARSAELAREDADALDALATELLREMLAASSAAGAGTGEDLTTSQLELPVDVLAEIPAALRQRVIRLLARERFGSHLSREHTLAVSALVTDWRGQGPIDVPGLTVTRAGGRSESRRRRPLGEGETGAAPRNAATLVFRAARPTL